MAEKDVQELEDKLKALFDKWAWIITSYGWRFDVCYYDNSSNLPGTVSADAAMTAFPKFEYLAGWIAVNLAEVALEKEERLEEMVVHELTHFLIDRLDIQGQRDEDVELATTQISRVILGSNK